MIKNTEELFKRGEKIELLVKKAGDLENMGFETHKMVKDANDKLWWENLKQKAMIAGAVVVSTPFCPLTALGDTLHSPGMDLQ